jgi:hypothetical protein
MRFCFALDGRAISMVVFCLDGREVENDQHCVTGKGWTTGYKLGK